MRETIFKDGAWIGGYEYSNERTLNEDIAQGEARLHDLKTRLAMWLGMKNPAEVPDELHQEFEEFWDEVQDECFSLAHLYILDLNKEYIDTGDCDTTDGGDSPLNDGGYGED